MDKNRRLILERVFSRGNIEEFRSVNQYYTRDEIRDAIKLIEMENIRIASLDDISAMKVNSVANDGTKVKDFIDLYFLLTDHKYDVESLLGNYKAKYSQRNAMHALKSLNYFEDVDLSDWPELLKRKDTSWKKIRETINKAYELYLGKITG